MTDIYLDPGAAALPDAADQLRHLTETGHRVLRPRRSARRPGRPAGHHARREPARGPATGLVGHHDRPDGVWRAPINADVDADRAEAGSLAASCAALRHRRARPGVGRPEGPQPRGDGLVGLRGRAWSAACRQHQPPAQPPGRPGYASGGSRGRWLQLQRKSEWRARHEPAPTLLLGSRPLGVREPTDVPRAPGHRGWESVDLETIAARSGPDRNAVVMSRAAHARPIR